MRLRSWAPGRRVLQVLGALFVALTVTLDRRAETADPEPPRMSAQGSWRAKASWARSSKSTNRTSSTAVSASRTVVTAIRAPSSIGQP